jgi:folate-dependent phosphoribosylglycinamide formyltransferase PurN
MGKDSDSATVLILGKDGVSTRIVYNAFVKEFGDVRVLLEARGSRSRFLLRRVRRMGITTVLGHLLFRSLAVPILRKGGEARVLEIKRTFGLDDGPIDESAFLRVPSVNSPAAREAIRVVQPAVIVVSGTRIIGRETLATIDVPIINLHAGITPLYRGVHGGYWALAEGRTELAGSTVHFIDEGIDTGSVIKQATFTVAPADSFATYPYLHLGVGVPILVEAVRGALAGSLEAQREQSSLPSRLRYHPTLWGYLARRIARRIR